MTWITSTSHEFHNIEGQKFACSNLLKGLGSAWRRVTKADSKHQMFEEVFYKSSYKQGSCCLVQFCDEEVLNLTRKADSWNNVTKLVLGLCCR